MWGRCIHQVVWKCPPESTPLGGGKAAPPTAGSKGHEHNAHGVLHSSGTGVHGGRCHPHHVEEEGGGGPVGT